MLASSNNHQPSLKVLVNKGQKDLQRRYGLSRCPMSSSCLDPVLELSVRTPECAITDRATGPCSQYSDPIPMSYHSPPRVTLDLFSHWEPVNFVGGIYGNRKAFYEGNVQVFTQKRPCSCLT